jgi:WD40 repeat protein
MNQEYKKFTNNIREEALYTLIGYYSRALNISGDYKYIATGCDKDKSVEIWSITGDPIPVYQHRLLGHSSMVRSISFYTNSQFVASGSIDEVKIWEVDTGICIDTIPIHNFLIDIEICLHLFRSNKLILPRWTLCLMVINFINQELFDSNLLLSFTEFF